METRYISLKECIKDLREYEKTAFSGLTVIGCISRIKRIPPANVRPVVRGEWLTGNDLPRSYGSIRAMCGRCGAFALYDLVNAGSFSEKTTNFCPNCGADMRPEEAPYES